MTGFLIGMGQPGPSQTPGHQPCCLAMDALSPEALERLILHDAGGLLVLNKPSDLPTSGRDLGDPDCLQFQLIQQRGSMVWAVHQLDADTTGLNLFVTQKHLVSVFKERMAWPNCEKTYLAILHGSPAWTSKQVQAPIAMLPQSSPPSLGVLDAGKPCSTHLQVLSKTAEHCLVSIRLETGRTHQIRIHAAHIGHPLVGEEWYRTPACRQHPRQALHAHRLRFGGAEFDSEFVAQLPQDLLQLGRQLNLEIALTGKQIH